MSAQHAEDQALFCLDTRLRAAVRLHRLAWAADPLYRVQRHHDRPAHMRRIAAALADATTALTPAEEAAMTDPVIHFAIPALTPLVAETALARCTTTRLVGDVWQVEKRWAGLSTGEQILWDVLGHLARRDALPRDLSARAYDLLDDENRRVVVDVLLALTAEYAADIDFVTASRLAEDAASELAFESARDARAER